MVLSLTACGSNGASSGNAELRDEMELFLGHYANCRSSHDDISLRRKMVAAGRLGDDKRVVRIAPRAAQAALAMQLCAQNATGASGEVGAYRDRIARPWRDISIGYELAGDGFRSGEPGRTRLLTRSEALQRMAGRELGEAWAAATLKYVELGGSLTKVKRWRSAN